MTENDTANDTAAAPAPKQSEQQFEVQKIYLKDVSFEAPNTPGVFTQEWKPDTNVQIQTNASQLQDNVHEVVLTVTVTAKCQKKTGYLVEVKQAGVFLSKGIAKPQLGQLLGSYCPHLLLPFAREAVSDLVTKGGFPQMLLAPVNFDALYAEHARKLAEQAQPPTPPPETPTITH